MSLLPDRLPPQSIVAEQAVIGATLISVSAVEHALEKLDTADFYLEAHRKIFDVVAYLWTRNPQVVPDTLTVPEELRKRGQLDACGGIAYILTLAESVPTTAHVKYYSEPVWEAAVRRRVISQSAEISATAYDEETPLDELEALIHQRAETPLARDLGAIVPAGAWMQATGDTYGPRAVGKPQHRYRTGFPQLDQYCAFKGGDLVIVAGRPSLGKTALVLEMIVGGAVLGYPGGLWSGEMRKEDVGLRMVCSWTARYDLRNAVPMPVLRDHAVLEIEDALTESQAERVATAESALSQLPFCVNDESGLTVDEIGQHARQMVRQHAIQALYVDYLQLIDYGRAENIRVGFTNVTKSLKGLARKLNIPVFVLSQLRRPASKRKSDRRPQLDELRETGAIESEADVVLLLHREAYYQRSESPDADDGDGGMEIIIAKNRNGQPGLVRAYSSLRCGRIFEPGTHRDDAPPEYDAPRETRPRRPEPGEEWWR